MGFLFGLIIVLLLSLSIQPILLELISYWYISTPILMIISYFIIKKSSEIDHFHGNQKALFIIKWCIRLFAVGIFSICIFFILMLLFFARDGTEGDFVNINKKLNVMMKDNTPCFYINAFEEIDTFEIQSIFAIKQVDNEASEYNEIVWDTPKIHIPFTAIVGKDQCIPYGLKNEIPSVKSKKLETDVLYHVEISGPKNIIPKKYSNYQVVESVYFYLSKNPQTGKSEIVLASQKEIENWENSMRMARLNPKKHIASEEDFLAEQIDEHNTTMK